jgi:nucleotide-binding universal stress UspA family protein
MTRVLLVIPPGIRPRAARERAIDLAAASGDGLVGLVLLDPAETGRIAATLDSAFMGERVSDRVVEVLAREQRSQAEALLAEIGEQAQARGVAFTPLIEEGDPEEVCARVIRAHQVREAILVVERRSWLSRILSRSATVRLPAIADCTLTVMEEPDDGREDRTED